jgi:hypothetical protein
MMYAGSDIFIHTEHAKEEKRSQNFVVSELFTIGGRVRIAPLQALFVRRASSLLYISL